jgi:tetratricopeptide (TPR) repeat protein/predicted O-methyltransferase YrrM
MYKDIQINNYSFKCLQNEFDFSVFDDNFTTHFDPCIIKKYQHVDSFDRLSFVIKHIFENLLRTLTCHTNIFFINTTHGGYLPITTILSFQNSLLDFVSFFVTTSNDSHSFTFNHNYSQCNTNLIEHISNENINSKYNNNTDDDEPNISSFGHINIDVFNIIFIEHFDQITLPSFNNSLSHSIIITKQINDFTLLINHKKYNFNDNCEYLLLIPKCLLNTFETIYQPYLIDNTFTLNNLLMLCMIVKNSGEQIKNTLIHLLEYVDAITIIDTGSSDNTVQIVNNVLKNTHKPTTFKIEQFVDFKHNRNSCLELAKHNYEYIITLDDTYQICNNLRNTLLLLRGSQHPNSFTLFIESSNSHNMLASNRIIKSSANLKYIYRVHEVIDHSNCISVLIPYQFGYIFDVESQYMLERSNNRYLQDLELLYQDYNDNVFDTRTIYNLGITHKNLKQYDKALFFLDKRVNQFRYEGLYPEMVHAALTIVDIKMLLNQPIEECIQLYLNVYALDTNRYEPYMRIASYYFNTQQYHKAMYYLKPLLHFEQNNNLQFSINLYEFLVTTCLQSALCALFTDELHIGLQACKKFFSNIHTSCQINVNIINTPNYQQMLWLTAHFNKLFEYTGERKPTIHDNKIICFVADGNYRKWNGNSLIEEGLGGSETFIVEIARNIKKYKPEFDIIVFCNTGTELDNTICDDVLYKDLKHFSKFIQTNEIYAVLVSRFVEYVTLSILKGYVDKIFFIAHDVTPINCIFVNNCKLKQILGLSAWHEQELKNNISTKQEIISHFNYGIDTTIYNNSTKIPNSFIYSSFPNRGLLVLLRMWNKIKQLAPDATLHIFSDVNGEWVNNNCKETMIEIKELLTSFGVDFEFPENFTKSINDTIIHDCNTSEIKKNIQNIEKSSGIFYYGWSPKKTIYEAFNKTEIWLYPCTFPETFCLTAYEAGITKNLIITSKLAALNTTVGKRGVLIEGDTTSHKWQKEALSVLAKFFSKKYNSQFTNLIESNYQFLLTQSWKSRAIEFFDLYFNNNDDIHSNSSQIYQYKGMFNWTNDIPQGSLTTFKNIIHNFRTNLYFYNKNNHSSTSNNNIETEFDIDNVTDENIIHILEIGTYAGTSLIGFSELIPNSTFTVIDQWKNYQENDQTVFMEEYQVKEAFINNITIAGIKDNVNIIQNNSTDGLLELFKQNYTFELIYVDGSHLMLDCMVDLELSWRLLSKNGLFIIDDYMFNVIKCDLNKDFSTSPFKACEHFLSIHKDELIILHKDYRLFVLKK